MSMSVPRLIAVASTLLWLVSALLLLLAASSLVYVTSPKAPQTTAMMPLSLALWALAYGAGGLALRGKRGGYRWWAAGLCLSAVAAVFLYLTPMTLIILTLTVAASVLVALDRRKTMG